uniref:protein-serine/threonine phosphatase n=1 Tax=Gongylonema pulchrum TaxID=637853 RepID=A0A183E2H0_9BILA
LGSNKGNFLQDIDASECGSPTMRQPIPISECYFYVKGTAVILLQPDRTNVTHQNAGGEIEQHLQAMLNILPPQDTLTMAVRLQSEALTTINHARYLAIVASTHQPLNNLQNVREVVLLGIDCLPSNKVTIGVAIPIYASTRVRLDGDGGVVVDFDSSLHIFRPVSVQAMWTMFQRLQKVKIVHFLVKKTEAQIYDKLKEVMQTVDLDEVTSRDIRLKVSQSKKVWE